MPGSPDNKLPGNERPNLSLRTRIGTIDANIELAGGPDRARLITNTFIGTIDARIVSTFSDRNRWLSEGVTID
jgi:hypothetical protein